MHRLVYTAIIPVLLLAVLSGLGMYKPVQSTGLLICLAVGRHWCSLYRTDSAIFCDRSLLLGLRVEVNV